MLGYVDYIVLGVFLVICLSIGLYFSLAGKRQSDTNEYFFGGRKLQALPVSISMFVSFSSAILILGSSAEIYSYGIIFWVWMLTEWVTIPFCAFFIMPAFYDTGAPTVTQYLGIRFNSPVLRKITSVALILRMLTYMSLCFLAPSMAFRTATSFPVWAIILISALVATIYTALGGIKAVVWTDTIQGIVLVLGLATILVKSSMDAGGWLRMFNVGIEHGRVYIPSFTPDPTVRAAFWPLFVGVFFALLPQYGFSQETLQRVMSLPSKRAARTSFFAMLPISLVINSLCVCIAVAVFAFYAGKKQCDLVKGGVVDSSNQVLPYYVFSELSYIHGFGGLFLASLSSGALSSVSSGLNGIAVMIWEDFVGPEWREKVSQKKAAAISKVVVFILGCSSAGIGIALSFMPGTIIQITDSVLSCFSGPLCGIFLLALFFPPANYKGAIAGAVAGLAVDLWLPFGRMFNNLTWPPLPSFSTSGCDAKNVTSLLNATVSSAINSSYGYTLAPSEPATSVNFTPGTPSHHVEGWKNIYLIHFFYYPLIGAFFTVVVGLIVSFATGRTKPSEVKRIYFSPMVRFLVPENGSEDDSLEASRRQTTDDWLDVKGNELRPLKDGGNRAF